MKFSKGLWNRLQKSTYRRAFVATNVGVQIATQLFALRTSRGKSQEKLAEEIGMNQATISQMEKPDYGKYNIRTLMRFAEYYDVALDVRFVSIREHVQRILNQTPETIAPPPFTEESEASPPGEGFWRVLEAFRKLAVEQPRPTGLEHKDIKLENILFPPAGRSDEQPPQPKTTVRLLDEAH